MVSDFARRVARAIRRRGLWAAGDRIGVAVSGGADSVALTLALAELATHADWALAGLVHVNHGLRGDESAADEQFCRDLAESLGVRIEVLTVDVGARRKADAVSLEAAARAARYEAFATAAIRLGASVVATAHTEDDQAETVLLRLLRGSGTRGVSAIRARRGAIARPLLDVSRADVVGYLAARRQDFREDSSNRDLTIPRNHLRHALMPVVRELAPHAAAALARFADLSSADEQRLSKAARRVGRRLSQSVPGGVQLNRTRLARLGTAVARRVVRDAIEAVGGRPSLAQVEAILRLVRSARRTGQLSVRGVAVDLEAEGIRFAAHGQRRQAGGSFSHHLPLPGEVTIPETGSLIRASLDQTGLRVARPRSAGPSVALQADAVVAPLTVRSRRPGDRIQPLGAPGSRKVQDLMVDRKIPCTERSAVPIVEDARGRILWVGGVAVAELARVTRPEAGVVILEITKDRT